MREIVAYAHVFFKKVLGFYWFRWYLFSWPSLSQKILAVVVLKNNMSSFKIQNNP
jgi:hypothetical protein